MSLLNLAARLREREFSFSELVLRMTREEIGSYLRPKIETVCRSFSKLQVAGLIEAKHRHVRIANEQALRELVSPHC